ncbi:hypothetical protein PoB_000838600 [Plakobranchus ocellatus]|uniref:Uncharacterized protein n=1 Tax=Plakobranchus ocellatus TaxID=259542 RepID=A0AAV3YHN8_9GAST|nr:hypothetical protein PoB_000838600 [Plakobranchus ocellatus]
MDRLSSLKALTDNGLFEHLQRHFIRHGKGRPCDPPQVNGVTNGLLLTLYVMKEECSASFRQLREWLQKLVPHTEFVSESRIYQRIQHVVDTCTSVPTETAIPFLQEEYCFNSLSDSLSALGLQRFHISGAQPYSEPPSQDVTNEVIVDLEKLRAQEREGQAFVHKWVAKLSILASELTNTQLKRKVDKCFAEYKKLLKNKNKSVESLCKLTEFLKTPFVKSEDKCIKPVPLLKIEKCKGCVNKDVTMSQLEEQHKAESILQLDVITSLNQDKTKLNEDMKDACQANKNLKEELKCVKLVNEDFKRELNSVKKSKLYQQTHAQKRKLKDLAIEKEHLIQANEDAAATIGSLREEVYNLKKKIKTEQTVKSKYKIACKEKSAINADLSDMLESEKIQLQVKEEGKRQRYSDNIRQTFYALQGEGNVAASNCSNVVATVAKHMFGTILNKEDLPCKSTALNFSNEASVIAHHHVVDEIINTNHFMFASDATSRQKSHYLEQHIQLSNGKNLSLGFTEIASDDSDTLLEKCTSMFEKLCEIYCKANEEFDLSILFKEVIRKLKCVMSDRASVMKSFDKKLAAFRKDLLDDEDCSTHFLFCNAHFLLALSAAAEQGISIVEKEWIEDGNQLGRDANPVYKSFEKNAESAATRTIRMASECLGPRGDEKSGARKEWLSFCSLKDIQSKFSSYRSNRFNNLFQNATAVLHHRLHVPIFLNEYVSHSNLKLKSILEDMSDKRVISNIAALSFFHIYFSEPYWLLMNSSRTYLEFPDYVKKMDCTLDRWTEVDFDLLSVTSVFSDFKAADCDIFVLKEFLKSDVFDQEIFMTTLKVIVETSRKALKRQLSDFLEGGVFGCELSDEVKDILKTCPLTNLTGERLFGDLDYDMNKRRNTSLSMRSTYCMWKHNKTAQWLASQNSQEIHKLIQKGIDNAPEWKQHQKDERVAVQEKVKQRIKENKWKKNEKEIKLREKKLAAINAMLGVPLATTKEELDSIFDGPKATEKMKDQIRYRSIVLGENITMTGGKKALYDKLLAQILSAHPHNSGSSDTNSAD